MVGVAKYTCSYIMGISELLKILIRFLSDIYICHHSQAGEFAGMSAKIPRGCGMNGYHALIKGGWQKYNPHPVNMQ